MRRMTQEILEHKTIDQIRNQGLDKEVMERSAVERAEMERQKQEQKERLPGTFLSLKSDHEQRVFLFTGQYQKLTVPAKDWTTRQVIPNKHVQKWRFQVYDVTDKGNTSPEPAIWERGYKEAEQVLYYLERGQAELNIVRSGAPGSTGTTYSIFPAK